MKVEVLFFGVLRKRAGEARRPVVLDEVPATAGELRAALSKALPELGDLGSVAIAIGDELLGDSDRLSDTVAEVALLPPVSGG